MKLYTNTKPNLTILSHGGGVQTQTLVEMIVEGVLEKPDAVIYAETGDHPKYVHKQVDYCEQRLKTVGIPLLRVSNGSLHDDVYGGGGFAAMPLFTRQLTGRRGKKQKQAKGQGAFFDLEEFKVEEPTVIAGFGMETQLEQVGMMKRQCTSDYKIVPIERELRVMLLEMGLAKETKSGQIRVKKGALVEEWIGFSMDETERVKPSQKKWARFRYPLIEMRMTRSDCLKWLEERNLPIPLSSACIKCPLISDERALELKQHDPEGYKNRVQFDRDLRNGRLHISASTRGDLYLHESCIPLDEIELDPKRPILIGCVGHCLT